MNENLLNEITEKLARIEEIQKKERRARIITLCSAALILAVLAIIFVPKMMAATESYRQISAKVQQIQTDLEDVDLVAMAETIASLQPMVEKLGEIDMSGLEKAADTIKGIDFSSLEEMLEGLKETVESWDIFGGLGNLFG